MKTEQSDPITTALAIRLSAHTHSRRVLSAAFSLVEVTLAIGVMGFAFVAIIGLVPVGLGNFRQTKNVSVASDISARILSELQDTPFTQLCPTAVTAGQSWSMTKADGSTIRYFDDQGTETTATDPSVVYEVNVCVYNAPAFLVAGRTAAQIQNTALASVTIQVAYDPGNLTLGYDSTYHVFTGTTTGGATVQIFKFNTYIAKNS